MKLLPAHMPSHRAGAAGLAVSAFTIVEMVIVALIFSWLVIMMVSLQIFALRIYSLAATKTISTQTGRIALDQMRETIRSANTTWVGTYNPTNGNGFVLSTTGMGNALQLGLLDTNGMMTNFITYYLDTTQPNTNTTLSPSYPICSISTLNTGVVSTLVNYVTNVNVFLAENFQGTLQANTNIFYLNNIVIHVIMQFDQWEYPVGFVGSNSVNAYDFYQLTTRITRRCKE